MQGDELEDRSRVKESCICTNGNRGSVGTGGAGVILRPSADGDGFERKTVWRWKIDAPLSICQLLQI